MTTEFDMRNWLAGSFRQTKKDEAEGKIEKKPINEGSGTDGTALLGGPSQTEPNTEKLFSDTLLLQNGRSGGTARGIRHIAAIGGLKKMDIDPTKGTTRIFPPVKSRR